MKGKTSPVWGEFARAGGVEEKNKSRNRKRGIEVPWERGKTRDEMCVKNAAMRAEAVSENLPGKAELKIKQEKAKGSRGFPFAFHICRQCRQNKGFSGVVENYEKGVAVVRIGEKWGQGRKGL